MVDILARVLRQARKRCAKNLPKQTFPKEQGYATKDSFATILTQKMPFVNTNLSKNDIFFHISRIRIRIIIKVGGAKNEKEGADRAGTRVWLDKKRRSTVSGFYVCAMSLNLGKNGPTVKHLADLEEKNRKKDKNVEGKC
ncbi:MAG: hypothetical protein IJF33_00520 [Clostridia bacterium]|nr:hypothetical protein [Clostridia bacterium]